MMKVKSVSSFQSNVKTLLMFSGISVLVLTVAVMKHPNVTYIRGLIIQPISVTKSEYLKSLESASSENTDLKTLFGDHLDQNFTDRSESFRSSNKDNLEQPNSKDAVTQHAGANCVKCRLESVLNWKRKDKENKELILPQSMLNESKDMTSNEKCIKRLPQAIIVGIQKCGTTALLQFLSDHPQIAACLHPVETQYFSVHFRKSLSWYQNLMPCSYSNQITIEKSPPYFYRRYCAEGIREMNPKTKIIIIVKDPISRAVSMYAMLKAYNKTGGLSFEDAVYYKKRNMKKKAIDPTSSYIDFSNYPKYMNAWLDNFKLKQMLFVDGHNLEVNPAAELKKVEHFLGIDTFFTQDRFAFNSTKGKYCFRPEKGKLKCLDDKKGRNHPNIDKTVRLKLEEYFRPKNNHFFHMIKKQFSWGY